jgi:hypothetical protein
MVTKKNNLACMEIKNKYKILIGKFVRKKYAWRTKPYVGGEIKMILKKWFCGRWLETSV